MQLREFLVRFRPVLSIPERSLSALDDFDRPLTEASVRLFAGALLDLIRDELENAGGDEAVRVGDGAGGQLMTSAAYRGDRTS